MRWLFLLLIVLNIFYCVWHLQDTPLRGKEIISLSLYKGNQQDIRLLSESSAVQTPILNKAAPEDERECLYITGVVTSEVLQKVQHELELVGLQSIEVAGELAGYVYLIASDGGQGGGERALQSLTNKFNGVKYETKRCGGLQPSDSLNRIAPAPQ